MLYLAPPSPDPARLTGHTFIDEEIRAVRDAGVECLTISDTIAESARRDGIDTVGLAPPRPRDAAQLAAFAARHVGKIPFVGASAARQLVHAMRIERIAADVVRRRRVSIVHSHFGWPGGFGGVLAAASAGVPLVASLRGMDVLASSDIAYGLRLDRAHDRAIRLLVRRADRTVYATEFMRSHGVALGARPERARVVRKGVDLAQFHPAADRAAAQRAVGVSGPLLLAVGGLSARKGVGHLLDAMHALRGLPWTLFVCGDGPDRDALEARARALGLGDRVRFEGAVPRARIGGYFAAADLFVHAAVIEAAGNVVLEALAAGCPVVAADGGGPREYIADGRTGYVVPPGDPEAMADRIAALLTNAALRCRMSRAARAEAEREYPYHRMIARYLAIYQELQPEASQTES